MPKIRKKKRKRIKLTRKKPRVIRVKKKKRIKGSPKRGNRLA